MFQSSRIASGMPARQISRACSPSSASLISKSRPSSIRRATLRMTLESSTTKHFFITSSLPAGVPAPTKSRYSRGLRAYANVEHAVDIENDQKLAVEPMDAGRNAHQRGLEIDRIVLAARRRQSQHLADRIDQEAVGLAPVFDP